MTKFDELVTKWGAELTNPLAPNNATIDCCVCGTPVKPAPEALAAVFACTGAKITCSAKCESKFVYKER